MCVVTACPCVLLSRVLIAFRRLLTSSRLGAPIFSYCPHGVQGPQYKLPSPRLLWLLPAWHLSTQELLCLFAGIFCLPLPRRPNLPVLFLSNPGLKKENLSKDLPLLSSVAVFLSSHESRGALPMGLPHGPAQTLWSRAFPRCL